MSRKKNIYLSLLGIVGLSICLLTFISMSNHKVTYKNLPKKNEYIKYPEINNFIKSNDKYDDSLLSGYTDKLDYKNGEVIDFFIKNPYANTTLTLYKLGGRKRVYEIVRTLNLSKESENNCSIDKSSAMVYCRWSSSIKLKVDSRWPKGEYVYSFYNPTHKLRYNSFFVVDAENYSKNKILYVVPANTYEAYNQYGGSSLYYNITGAGNKRFASAVSFLRPFTNHAIAGGVFRFDLPLTYFLYREHYSFDVVTNSALESSSYDLSRYKVIILSGHDEYWGFNYSKNLLKAESKGVSILNLGADTGYWAVVFSKDKNFFYCNKVESMNSKKVLLVKGGPFNEINSPNSVAPNQLLGNNYAGIVSNPTDWVISNAKFWGFRGEKVYNGEKIPNLVTGEADGIFSDLKLHKGTFNYYPISKDFFKIRKNVKNPTRLQNTIVSISKFHKQVIFDAGTFGWIGNLNNPIIKTLTKNLINYPFEK